MKRILLLLFIIPFLASCVHDPAEKQTEPDTGKITQMPVGEVHPGLVRVKFSPLEKDLNVMMTRSGGFNTGIPEVDALAQKLGATRIERVFPDGNYPNRTRKAGLHLWYDFYLDDDTPLTRAMDDLAELDCIRIVEGIPVEYSDADAASSPGGNYGSNAYSTRASGVPTSNFNDPLLNLQWHYQNDGTTSIVARAGADINLFPAWNITTGDPRVIVAVMDGGADFSHPDLAQNMWINEGEIDGDGIDNDGNGYIDDIYGWRFSTALYPESGTILPLDHGTHCSGTVAGVNNNGIGVGGVAGGNGSPGSGARIMTLQYFLPATAEPYDFGDSAAASNAGGDAAFKYAADNGAVIISCSFSGTSLSQARKAAMDYFIKYAGTKDISEPGSDEELVQVGPMKGGVIVASAGNYNNTQLRFPGAYNPVISVSNINNDFTKVGSSTFGTWVDIAAFGGDTSLTYGDNSEGATLSLAPMGSANYSESVGQGYRYMNGTSMSCPHVSGVAALVVSAMVENGVTNFTNDQLKEILLTSVHDIDQYNPAYAGQLGVGYIDAYLAVTNALRTYAGFELGLIETFYVSQSMNGITVNWEAIDDGYGNVLPKYYVYWSTAAMNNVDLSNPPAGVKSAEVSDNVLTAGRTLSYTITEFDPAVQYYVAIVGETSGGTRTVPVYTNNSAEPQTPTFTVTSGTVTDYITVGVNTRESKTANVKIVNSMGHKVLDTNVTVSSYSAASIDVRKLTGGVYTLILTYGGKETKYTIAKL